jgi:hypothetical protein
MTKLTRAAFKAIKNTRFTTNGVGAITGATSNAHEEDTADSVVFLDSDVSLNSDFTVDGTKLTDRATIKAFVEANSDKLFLGYYTSEANLIAAHATADEGNWAIVDIGIGEPATIYIWDNDDEEWVAGGAAGDFWSLEGTSTFLDNVTIDTDDNDLTFDVGTGKFEILGDFYIKVGAGNTSGVPEIELLPSQAEALRITNGTVDYLTFNTSNGRVEVDQLLRGNFTQDDTLQRLLVSTTNGDVYYTVFQSTDLKYYEQDDFLGQNSSSILNSRWQTANPITGNADAPNEFGVAGASTVTSSTGIGYLAKNNNNASVIFGTGTAYKIGFRAALITALSDGTQTYTITFGFHDNPATAGDATDGAYFRYTHSVNGGRWEAVTRSNTTETAQDTTISPTADTFQVFHIEVNSDATEAKFYINGVLRNTITTNIPSGSGRLTNISFKIEKSAGTTERYFLLDWFDLIASRTTPR